jgi:hypothetical protein
MGIAAVAMIATLRAADWSLTALPRVDSKTRLGATARILDPGFHRFIPARTTGSSTGESPSTRWRSAGSTTLSTRPRTGTATRSSAGLAGFFSAGRARAVQAALAPLGLLSLFAAAAGAAALGVGRGTGGWEGLFVALNPRLIGAATHELGESLAAALMVGAIAAYVGGRRAPTWICLALLPLSKEPLLVVCLALVVWELVQHRRRRAAVFATAAIPALLWWTYTRVQLGSWFMSGDSALGLPLAGWSSTLFDGRGGEARGAGVVILVSLVGLLAFASLRAVRRRGPVELSYLALVALAACLAPNATLEFSTALRNTAFFVVLLPFVVASRRIEVTSRR